MQEPSALNAPTLQPVTSPILIAAQSNDWESVKQLCSESINWAEQNENGRTLIHFAALYGQDAFLRQHASLFKKQVNAQDDQGATPLYLATCNRHWECVKALLIAKADMQIPTNDELAIVQWVKTIKNPAILDELLSTQREDVQYMCLLVTSQNHSLLHHAAAAGQTRIVQFILEKTAGHSQINTQNAKGCTPLFEAIFHGHTETVGVLLQHGACLDHLNINGDNPIYYAIRCGQLALAELLIQHLLCQFGFDQRPETPALLRAFVTLFAYHHQETRDVFFKQAQREQAENERQQGLLDLVAEIEEKEEAKQAGHSPQEGQYAAHRAFIRRGTKEAFSVTSAGNSTSTIPRHTPQIKTY